MESTTSSSSNNKGKNVVKQRTEQHTTKAINYLKYVPLAILYHILTFMPIRELMVMSLLSNRWKAIIVDFVSMIPQSLSLHESEMTKGIPKKDLPFLVPEVQSKFIDFVDRCFLLHSGCTINSLKLFLSFNAYKRNGYTEKIDNWVHFSLTSDIKELSLDFSDRELLKPYEFSQKYVMPDGCFAPKILKTLILTLCRFRLSSFQVFGCLQSISLVLVHIFDCSLAELVSKCPVLQDVRMENCIIADNFLQSEEDIMIKTLSIINCETFQWPPYGIDLSTPCLLKLTIIRPHFTTSHIRNATELLEVYIVVKQMYANPVEGEALGSFFTNLNHCRSLILNTWCIQVLPIAVNLLGQLPANLNYLKHLHLPVALVKQELPGIYCLLQSCPNLENLTLHMQEPVDVLWENLQEHVEHIFNFEEGTYWETQNLTIDCLHFFLKKVAIHGFAGETNELKLIEFLLKAARKLERMDIYSIAGTLYKDCNPQQLELLMSIQGDAYQMLLNLPKASPQALITLV